MTAYWDLPENKERGDNPNWKVPPIPESAQQQAQLYVVQCRLRAEAIHAELKKQKRSKTVKAPKSELENAVERVPETN